MRRFIKLIFLILMAGLAGCNLPGMISATSTTLTTSIPTVTPVPSPTVEPSATPLPVLSVDGLRNGTYLGPQYQKTFTLVDGKYAGGSGPDTLNADMLPQMAFGDLNQDGLEDAVVLIAENGGGSGVFVSLLVLYNQNGTSRQGGAVLIDDRPKINTIAIQDGKILIDAIIHGVGDSMVNPTLAVKEVYESYGDLMELARFETLTPNGITRSIQITNPEDGIEVTGSVQVQGSMPIAPFENNLGYRILDAQGKQLLLASFLVNADQPGGPATFDQTIDLNALAGAGWVRLSLVEVSMADGSLLTLNSVRFKVK